MRYALLVSVVAISTSIASVAAADDVNDPMLAPVPRPKHVLADWGQAMAMVKARDIDLKTALIEVERAKGDWRVALASALPQIVGQGIVSADILRDDVTEVDAAGRAATTSEPPPSATAALTLTQPLFALKAWYDIGVADDAIDLAKISSDDAERRLVANVSDAIVGVVSAEQVSEINRSELRAALSRLDLAKHGASLGVSAGIDVLRFEQDANDARDALVDGDEQLLEARERLGLALGDSEPWGVAPDMKLDDIDTSAKRACKPGSMKDRPDIRALYAKKAIDEHHATDVDLEYVPTIDLTATLAASTEPLVGDDGHGQFNVMGVLTVPIWDGGARYGEARSVAADIDETELAIQSAERQATVEISQADRATQVAARRLDLANKSLELARSIKRAADDAFSRGASTSFEIVDATTKVREAELAVSARQLELTRAKIALISATSTCKY